MSEEAEETTEKGWNGAAIRVRFLGRGRPVLMLHGLFSNAHNNWIRYGHAQRLAERGFRAIMPDFRAHGGSDRSHDPADYPPEVLARDMEALVAGLNLEDFDLVGFSLGARTAAKLMARGMRPRRAALGGMGLEGLTGWPARRDFFLNVIDRREAAKHGEPEFLPVQFMKQMKVDPEAARLLLGSFGELTREEIAGIPTPTLVVCGQDDRDNGSPRALVDCLPDARLAVVPGNHMASVTKPDLGIAIADFLSD